MLVIIFLTTQVAVSAMVRKAITTASRIVEINEKKIEIKCRMIQFLQLAAPQEDLIH